MVIVMVRHGKKAKGFEFKTERNAMGFVKELKNKYPNIEYAIGRPIKKGKRHGK